MSIAHDQMSFFRFNTTLGCHIALKIQLPHGELSLLQRPENSIGFKGLCNLRSVLVLELSLSPLFFTRVPSSCQVATARPPPPTLEHQGICNSKSCEENHFSRTFELPLIIMHGHVYTFDNYMKVMGCECAKGVLTVATQYAGRGGHS